MKAYNIYVERVRFNPEWKANTSSHALRSNHLNHADAYSSDSAASAFCFCLLACVASSSALSLLHIPTRISYSSRFPKLFNDSSRTPARESCAFFFFCCPARCAFSGSQSSTKTLNNSLCAILFRSLAFRSPFIYLSSLKNRHPQT